MRTDITGERLIERLTDGEWHDTEEVRRALIPTVAPGKALRTYKRRSKPETMDPTRVPDEDRQILSGARIIATDRINSLSKTGRIEFSEDRKQIRLVERRVVPEGACPTCARPFPKPTPEQTKPVSETKPVVLYPDFPTWRERLQEAT